MSVLSRRLRNVFDRRVAEYSITRSQWAMIAVVSRNQGSTQRVIAEALEMSEASAGRLIDRLCAEGLLERRDRDGDRRARSVYVTEKAEPLLVILSEIANDMEERMFAGFSNEDLVQFHDLVERVYANVAKR